MESVSCLVCGSDRRVPVLRLRPDAHRKVHAHTRTVPIHFVACEHCGFIYQTPRYTLDDLKPIYADEYRKDTVEIDGVPKAEYLAFARAKSRREFEWIAKRLGKDGGRVLEVGCATGQLLRYFKDAGWDPVGLEPTRSFAEYGARAHGVPIHPTFLEEADLTPGFDVVILSQVLEHLQDPCAMLARAGSMLAPGGRIYVSVPYSETYLPIRPARELFISTHLYAFSPASLANVAARAGFAVEDQGADARYLCAMLRPEPAASAQAVLREDPRAVARRIRYLARRYFFLYDSRFLLAEWAKRRLRQTLGEGRGDSTITALRRLKHSLQLRRSS
jgi:SAM-dependent methyltransferase